MTVFFYKLLGGEKGLATSYKVITRDRIDKDISLEVKIPGNISYPEAGKPA